MTATAEIFHTSTSVLLCEYVCMAVVVVTVGSDFDGSRVAWGMDLISQTAAL